jgi:hypothetical protein
MDNQNNNLQELEELRSQVAEFKKRVEQQEIVSRRLLRVAMKGHVSWIKRMSIWGSVGELVILPFLVYALRSVVGVSWMPIIVLGLMLVGEAVFNFWNVSTIRDKHLAVDDVLSAQQRLITFKRREKLYTFGILPFLFLWVVWLLFDVYYGTDIPFFPSSERLLVYFVVIVVAFAILSYVFSREMRSLDNAIKDIDEFAGKNSQQ